MNNNINFLVWASVCVIQLFVLDAHNQRISSLESKVASLIQRVGEVEADLNCEIDKLLTQRLIDGWISDEEYDPR